MHVGASSQRDTQVRAEERALSWTRRLESSAYGEQLKPRAGKTPEGGNLKQRGELRSQPSGIPTCTEKAESVTVSS